jgi:hypothetical protein
MLRSPTVIPALALLSGALFCPGALRPADAAPPARKAVHAPPKGGDIMATVDGKAITRRELTALWLSTDPQAAHLLGDLLTERWQADGGQADAYTVTSEAIYARLYAPVQSGATAPYAPMLANLVSIHLVEHEARRHGIVVTPTEAQAEGHRLFDQVRAQRGLKWNDAQMMINFRVPRDAFYQDMTFRLRTERLIAADIARRNGHPIGAGDWVAVRELFAGSVSSATDLSPEQQLVAAKDRVAGWAAEVRGGKSMAEVAAEHNENETKSEGGLLKPALRGTGTPAIEAAIFALKPGELSAPIQGHDGWYVFRVERKGDQISAQERRAMWEQLLEVKRNPFLADLLKHAKITSVVPLAANRPASPTSPPASDMPPAPPNLNGPPQ